MEILPKVGKDPKEVEIPLCIRTAYALEPNVMNTMLSKITTEIKKTGASLTPLPRIGQRMVKTAVAVYLCLLICYVRSLFGQGMSAEAAITAVICIQPYMKETKASSIERFSGTLLGSICGLLFLILLAAFPALGANTFLLYALMATGVLLSLYSAVLFRQPDTSSLAAIVFICIVISYPNIDEPLVQAINRFIDVLIGTCAAIAVNNFRLPRITHSDKVYFLRTKDLVPDRNSQMAPSVLFRITSLLGDGAKICLMSEHAPAFFETQMRRLKVNTPLIVMDGAAIYDAGAEQYLYKEPLPPEVSAALLARLEQLGIGCFVYTIHKNKTCIFHRGPLTAPEKAMYETMRTSPYRYYLEGEILDPSEIVYVKALTTEEKIVEILADLNRYDKELLASLRPVVRHQTGTAKYKGLYFYSVNASLQNAQTVVMRMLDANASVRWKHNLKLRAPYRGERDALHLLRRVEKSYEPLKLK